MKVALIHPPMLTMTDRRVSPPLGILYLASYLRDHMDLDIEILDQNLNDNVSVAFSSQQVLETEADLYGISFGTPQYAHAVSICRALKETHPNRFVVCGGPHPTALPYETLVDTGCDAIVESEGEETFLRLVERLTRGDRELHSVSGLFLLDPDHQLHHTGTRAFLKDLDTIPFPARDLVDFGKYTRTINGEPATTIITARGCPGRCIFCSQHAWKRNLRLRSVESILSEIDHVQEAFGIRNILFLDDTLTVNRKRIFRLCDALKERGVTWRGWTRANTVDLALMERMADSNCMALCIGVESGSQTILDNLRKGTTVEDNRKALKAINEAGMYARASLIVGSPGETWETVQETIDFVIETEPDDWLLSIFVPVPGSEAFVDAGKYGIRFLEDANRISYYSNFFVTGGDMVSGQVMEYEHLRREEIMEMRNHVFETLMEKCPPKLHRAEGLR